VIWFINKLLRHLAVHLPGSHMLPLLAVALLRRWQLALCSTDGGAWRRDATQDLLERNLALVSCIDDKNYGI
jgi:hypothetical protein